MKNWLKIQGIQKRTGNGLLLNRNCTITEVYRLKSILRQIECAEENLYALLERLSSIIKTEGQPDTKDDHRHVTRMQLLNQIRSEFTLLLASYDSLGEIVEDNKSLEERFRFELTETRTRLAKLLQDGLFQLF